MTTKERYVYVLSDHVNSPDSDSLDYVFDVVETMGAVEESLLKRASDMHEGNGDPKFLNKLRRAIVNLTGRLSSGETQSVGHWVLSVDDQAQYTVTGFCL